MRTKEAEKGAGGQAADPPNLTSIVGTNLRRLRTKRGLSLERLSKKSGVSRAMLGQIELGQSAPTINVMWRIAAALSVPFGHLLGGADSPGAPAVIRRLEAKVLRSPDGGFSSRALFPVDAPRTVEFYEVRLAAGGREAAVAHAPGTMENLVVSSGRVELRLDERTHALATGDAILFEADRPHAYVNPGDEEAVLYLVMSYSSERNA